MSANMVPPFSEGTSFACSTASSGSVSSKVESVCQSVARLTPYQSICARLLHVGQPGDFRTIGVAILDQRVGTRRAETAAEGGELGRAQVLVPEHQHRMLGKGTLDPGEGAFLEWL